MHYNHIVNYLTDQPWAIMQTKLEAIADLVALRASGLTLTPQEVQARIGETRVEEPENRKAGVIAVLPVFGTIAHRMNMFTSMSGGTSSELLAKNIRKLAADPSVETIVLDIDSPGGEFAGMPELFSTIFKARAEKRIIAVANALAASGAYYLAAAADEIVVTPSGIVGSIGVYSLHFEASKAIEEAGLKYTIVKAGKYKAEGNMYEPLSDDTQEYMQRMVDEAYDMFVKDLARGRGVKVSVVKAEFGQGRVFRAKNAVAAGMADRVATLE